MKVGFASDHAGLDLKNRLMGWATKEGHEVVDFGTTSSESVDYVDYAYTAIKDRQAWDRLVLVCGSGIGMSISANRLPEIRCALVTSKDHARLARQHNNANAIALGQRLTDPLKAEYYLQLFLETPFDGGRHQKRVDKMSKTP